jgi:hypothetical protein
MENMGEDNLEKNPDNSLPESNNPQDELEALLQQSQPQKAGKSGLVLPEGNPKKNNWLVWGIGSLAVVLLAGTIYFLVWGVGANKGSLVVFLNEGGTILDIDGRDFGMIDNGFKTELSAGEHVATLTKEGFLEAKETFELKRGQETEVLWEILPVPFIELLVEGESIVKPRLSLDGSEVSFWDSSVSKFKTVDIDDGRVSELFDGQSFSGVQDLSWSDIGQTLVARLSGVRTLKNMVDNRSVRGAYVPLGERPVQGPSNNSGVYTWYFGDIQNTVALWQPVLLNENIRQVAFSVDGGSLVYINDPAGEEYSLVMSKPDGEEWKRLIVELPDLRNARMTWGPDDRYLILEDGAVTYLADLVAKAINPILAERVEGTLLKFSSDGDKLAYVGRTENGGKEVRVYDLVGKEDIVIETPLEDLAESRFVWINDITLLFALPNQTFREIGLEDGGEKLIPFVGQDTSFDLVDMEYSRAGKVLMLETSKGIFKMKF